MCGRYEIAGSADNPEILEIIQDVREKYPDKPIATGEIFPSDLAPIIIGNGASTTPDIGKWGFVNFENKPVINARAETAREKHMFRNGILKNRCAIPSTGFFEWTHEGVKKKYLFRLADTPILYLAGIFDESQDERRFVILTTQANSSVSSIHSRMPVLFEPKFMDYWINDKDAALEYLTTPMPALEKIQIN